LNKNALRAESGMENLESRKEKEILPQRAGRNEMMNMKLESLSRTSHLLVIPARAFFASRFNRDS